VSSRAPRNDKARGSANEVFGAFLRLGLTSFGGPVAHLAYFRDEFVERRRWLSDRDYADLIALCQFLPGPASSQAGFALGLQRAGWAGALAAFTAFTLPSALLMLAFASGLAFMTTGWATGAVAGLKIAAVAVVAQAVWGMSRTLCPDRPRAALAVLAVVIVALLPGPFGMVAAIAAGALAGFFLLAGDRVAQPVQAAKVAVARWQALACLAAFAGLMVLLPILGGQGQGWAVFDAFYRAGALVFGGGHVVLPLLEAEMVQTGRIDRDAFLAGYGAAQAVPGPLFTFAAFLGAVQAPGPHSLGGALLALGAIFLPGFLLLAGILPFWEGLRRQPALYAGMQGANAAVVGILAAALHDPVFTGSVRGPVDFALAVMCFVALTVFRAPALAVVAFAAAVGAARALAMA